MKLRDSLVENNSILYRPTPAPAGSRQAERGFTGEGGCRGAALLPCHSGWRCSARPLFCDCSRSGDAARSAGRGVKKTGFALVTLKTPLVFNHEDNDPVDILITMAAVDANTHQEVGIMQIVNLFEDEANFDRLRACRSAQEVLELIDNATAAAV